MSKKNKYRLKKLITRVELGDKFSEKQNVSEIEVLTEGYWEHDLYGTIEITPKDIDLFIKNFNDKVRKIDIAVDQDHRPQDGAAGWYKELKKVVEDGVCKLKAVIEWTKLGTDLLSQNIYKYFSADLDFEYEDPETHETFENVLLGGGLTNRPYFKSLAPVQLSENIFINGEITKFEEQKGGDNILMTKEELKTKLEEDAKFELPEDATDEQKGWMDELKSDSDEDEEELNDDADDKSDDDSENEEEGGEESADVKASEVPSAKEFNEVKSKLGVMEKKLRFSETVKTVHGYTFSESNPEGRLLPKSSKVVQKLLMSLSDRQAKLFGEVINSMPKVDSMMFDEMGGGEDGDSVKASEELTSKADALAKETGLTFGQAMKKVSADNPELVKKADKGE